MEPIDFTTKIPDKLYKLVEIAKQDVLQRMEEPGFRIDMDIYITINSEGKPCQACLAGCYILGHIPELIGVDDINWEQIDSVNERKLDALDSLRSGYVTDAVKLFYYMQPEVYTNYNTKHAGSTPFHFTNFSSNPTEFLAYLDNVIAHYKLLDI